LNALKTVEGARKRTDGIHTIIRVTATHVKEVGGIREPAVVTIDLALAPGVTDALETDVGGVWHVVLGGIDRHGRQDSSIRRDSELLVDGPLVSIGLGLSGGVGHRDGGGEGV